MDSRKDAKNAKQNDIGLNPTSIKREIRFAD